MCNKSVTQDYYTRLLGFTVWGSADYSYYLMLNRENVQLHFFLFEALNPAENYSQVYIRTNDIEQLYKELADKKVLIHPNAPLQTQPWGQREFSVLDPDNNLLTFGQSL